MDNIWEITATVALGDGSVRSGSMLKDYNDNMRLVGDLEALFHGLSVDSAVALRTRIANVLGLTIFESTLIEDAVDTVWRFNAITTSGGINVIGSTHDLGAGALTDDFDAVVAELGHDDDFAAMIGS